MKGTKKVKGNNYEIKNEAYEKKMKKKDSKGMKTAGIQTELKLSQKDQEYSKLPKVKKAKKGKGFIK